MLTQQDLQQIAAKGIAEEQMRQKQSIQEYYHSRASLSRALTRLKATSKYQ